MKDQFHISDGVYLLSHSVGLQPKSCQSAIHSGFLEPWAQDPEQVWPNWLEGIAGFRENLAQLLNTNIDLICPQVNLSSAYLKVLQSLTFEPGRNVVLMSESDFPSMVFVAEQMQRMGLELRLIPADKDPCVIQTWEQYFSDDVALVLLSHVYSNTGRRLDIPGIAKLARATGVKTLVDVAQSIGLIPIDLEDWAVDFVLGSCVKWLCGGPGAGFLWVSQTQLPECKPVDVGWFSHENPFEFDVYNFRYHDTALRFWGGTPSVLPYICAANSIAWHSQHGVLNNYHHNRQLCAAIIDALPAGSLINPIDEQDRGGTLIIHLGDRHNRFLDRLQAANIKFDARAFGVRISPHIYNNQTDIDRFIACL